MIKIQRGFFQIWKRAKRYSSTEEGTGEQDGGKKKGRVKGEEKCEYTKHAVD